MSSFERNRSQTGIPCSPVHHGGITVCGRYIARLIPRAGTGSWVSGMIKAFARTSVHVDGQCTGRTRLPVWCGVPLCSDPGRLSAIVETNDGEC